MKCSLYHESTQAHKTLTISHHSGLIACAKLFCWSFIAKEGRKNQDWGNMVFRNILTFSRWQNSSLHKAHEYGYWITTACCPWNSHRLALTDGTIANCFPRKIGDSRVASLFTLHDVRLYFLTHLEFSVTSDSLGHLYYCITSVVFSFGLKRICTISLFPNHAILKLAAFRRVLQQVRNFQHSQNFLAWIELNATNTMIRAWW